MKILIDENLPLKLKRIFGKNHEVFSVRDMGWQGKKNGELLGLMTLDGFEILVTMDKNLPNQQNLGKFPVLIFILRGSNNKFVTLQTLIPHILEQIESGIDSGVIEISE